MRVREEKVFMDPVHGYISIPKCFVKYIIDTDYFQRLRNIDQTGMRILFPNAKHDRFCHSLGVFYLGRKAVSSLRNNSEEKFSEEEWKLNEVLFLLACLLHDIGHTPFSHSLEDQVFKNSINIDQELEEKLYGSRSGAKPIEGASHEKMGSLLLFNDFFREQIRKVLYDLGKEPYYTEIFGDKNKISDDILNDYLTFMARMIMGIKYEYNENNQFRNCFIELLNWTNFDVDNLDYIVRDTQMSGIRNIAVDIERLFNSLCIVTKTKYISSNFERRNQRYKIERGIVDEAKNGNQQELEIKGNLTGSICIKKNSQVTIMKDSYFNMLSNMEGDNGRIIINGDEGIKFGEYTKIEKNMERINISQEGKDTYIILYPEENRQSFNCKIENAKTKKDFSFTACDEIKLSLKSECHMKIKGGFRVLSSISLYNTDIFGIPDECVVLDMKFNNKKMPNIPVQKEYSIGLKKQSINIISNVLDARNYLYLWIYAHHKVVYYANFLIPVIAKTIFEGEIKCKPWEISYNDLKNLDDNYLWMLIKMIYNNSENSFSDEEKKLISEIMSRTYKHSLYKSLAEFDLFFENTTKEQMEDIVNSLATHTDTEKPYLSNLEKIDQGSTLNRYIAGYLDNDILEKINSRLNEYSQPELNNILYVYANYKSKKLNVEKVYINVNGNIVTMDDIDILNKQSQIDLNNKKQYYFYLYYELKEEEKEVDDTILKSIIRGIFSTDLIDKRGCNCGDRKKVSHL